MYIKRFLLLIPSIYFYRRLLTNHLHAKSCENSLQGVHLLFPLLHQNVD